MIQIPLIILAIEDPDDREFMTKVYRSHNRLIYSTAKAVVKNTADAEDVLQLTTERLIDKIALLKTLTRKPMVNYIISATRNTALNFLRDNKKHEGLPFDEELDSMASGADFKSNILSWEFSSDFWGAWLRLDERSRDFLNMKYSLEMSDAEIARTLGIKPGSVRMTLTRARRKLLSLMEDTVCPD